MHAYLPTAILNQKAEMGGVHRPPAGTVRVPGVREKGTGSLECQNRVTHVFFFSNSFLFRVLQKRLYPKLMKEF